MFRSQSLKKQSNRKSLKLATHQLGLSLIELMVGLIIGLIVSLAVYTVLNTNEARKRTTTSVNDIDQAGSYATYQLDKAIRSAGSGFMAGVNPKSLLGATAFPNTPAANYTVGCLLRAARSGTTIIPSNAAYPAPFDTVLATINAIRVAPVVILNGIGTRGDVLMVMEGSAGLSESINTSTSPPTASSLNLENTAGFRENDRVLIAAADANSAPVAGSACLMSQVEDNFNQGTGDDTVVNLAGDYYQANVGGVALTGFTSTAVALNLGRQPSFNLFGVGANNTLFKYDLLRPAVAVNLTAIANDPNPMQYVDSVYQLEAIYGVSATKGALAWQPPTGAYAAATLLNGSAASNANLRNIKAVRIALVMRTSLQEKLDVSTGTINLFESTGPATTVAVTTPASDTKYRFKVLESTIPIRNALAIARD